MVGVDGIRPILTGLPIAYKCTRARAHSVLQNTLCQSLSSLISSLTDQTVMSKGLETAPKYWGKVSLSFLPVLRVNEVKITYGLNKIKQCD